MSDRTTPEVTASELNQWLSRDKKKQSIVAERLLVSPRTMEGWRQGRTIPAQYHAPLKKMMYGEDSIELQLPAEVMQVLRDKAEQKGFKNVEAYLSEFVKGFLALALLAVVGHQVFHPDHGQARRFGSRRKQEGIEAVEIMDGECA